MLRIGPERVQARGWSAGLPWGQRAEVDYRQLSKTLDSSRKLSIFSRKLSIRLDLFSTTLDIYRQNSLFLDVFSKIKSTVESAVDPETAQAWVRAAGLVRRTCAENGKGADPLWADPCP
jgi:hypothetical protein